MNPAPETKATGATWGNAPAVPCTVAGDSQSAQAVDSNALIGAGSVIAERERAESGTADATA